MPLGEIALPELPDASVFALEAPTEHVDVTDERNHWSGGELKHVYRSRLGFRKEICPVCSKETSQKYISLVYASDCGARQSFSPCAWICEPCSCVVLDEQLPAQSAHWKGYSYVVPVGVSKSSTFFRRQTEGFKPFTTYEGKKPVFVVDEDSGAVTDVFYADEINSSTRFDLFETGKFQMKQISEEKRRQKRKAEKRARKKQRH